MAPEITRVRQCADAWQGKRIAVIGDFMLDRYVWGHAARLSQEAPIPVVEARESTLRPGGAANVLHNLQVLGAKAYAFGVVGDDPNGAELVTLLERAGVHVSGVSRARGRVTTEKTRILAGNQQVVRVDTERREPLSEEQTDALMAGLMTAVKADGIDGIILEDYGKGTLTKALASAVAEFANASAIPLALDPHPANCLQLAHLTLMTPNRAEAFALAGHYLTERSGPVGDDEPLLRVAEHLHRTWQVRYLLITLGAGGMALFQEGKPPLHVPTVAREVFDVSGAGDTVISAFTLAHVAGAEAEEAAVIANHAAGVVVGKLGTAAVTIEELLASFDAAYYE